MRFEMGTRSEFLTLYKEVFGKDFDGDRLPSEISIARDSDTNAVVGFMAGHINFDGSFYIQSSGVLPQYRENGLASNFKHLLLDNLNYFCVVEAGNAAAMRVLLASGFKPIGMRQMQNQLYLEWQKERTDA